MELPDERSAQSTTPAITKGLFAAQLGCWLGFLYMLYYYVPAYKMLHRDYSDVTPSSSWHCLVALSDWLVINAHSDAVFPFILVMFFVILITLNVYLGSPTYSKKSWVIWSIVAFALPFLLLAFETATIATSVNKIITHHPEVLDYGLWWINVFK